MKRITLWLFGLLMVMQAFGQRSLYRETDFGELGQLSEEETKIVDLYARNPLVVDVLPIQVDFKAFGEKTLGLSYRGQSTVATEMLREGHGDVASEFSWFGSLTDETGIFFTVIGQQLASKFYLGNIPMLIVPLREDYHILVAYSNDIDQGVCGLEGLGGSEKIGGPGKPSAERIESGDECVMRVLWVVTSQAEPEISMTLDLAARMLQDETNLAYLNSQISYRMEMARVLRTTYVETTATTSSTAYGVPYAYPSDLINLSTGAGLLSAVPTMRDLYEADIVVMVRSQATNSAQGFYGIAYGVPVDPYLPAAGNAFALISTEYMIGGRFTFAHEMGHIQGARHDTHSANPVYARGYVFAGGSNNNRTIMAVGGSCNPPTGCRVQFFSNANVTYAGTPVGVAGQRENYLRINGTAPQVLNFRITDATLMLPNEVFDNEILARHLATNAINSNYSSIVALNGSRVAMKAGNEILLLPGFSAEYGSNFFGYIGGCDIPITFKQQPDQLEATIAEPRLKASPNPTNGNLSLSWEGEVGQYEPRPYRVLDMMGRTIAQGMLNTQGAELDLSGNAAGAYSLLAELPSGKVQVIRVVLQ